MKPQTAGLVGCRGRATVVLILVAAFTSASAWTLPSSPVSECRTNFRMPAPSSSSQKLRSNADDNDAVYGKLATSLRIADEEGKAESDSSLRLVGSPPAPSPFTTAFSTFMAAAAAFWSFDPPMAMAAAGVIPSALVAYGHYVSLMAMTACVMWERVIIQPNMSSEAEDQLTIADSAYGIIGLVLFGTGYLRVTQYGKGWDYYSHEPLFWLKMTFAGILGASSFFNTVKIVQRGIVKRNNPDELEPLSEKLAARMIQICNAELVALACIPLTATFVSRGVLYSQDIPWQIGATLTALTFGGLSYKYVKEALMWTEDKVAAE